MGGNVFYFFYKITRRKLKRENSFLYQSINAPIPFMMAYAMTYNGVIFPWFPPSYSNTTFSQSKLTFLKCYFIKVKCKYAPYSHETKTYISGDFDLFFPLKNSGRALLSIA